MKWTEPDKEVLLELLDRALTIFDEFEDRYRYQTEECVYCKKINHTMSDCRMTDLNTDIDIELDKYRTSI